MIITEMFGHRFTNLQGDEKKNINTIMMCWNNSRVKNNIVFV
jgi:hypothetical protein